MTQHCELLFTKALARKAANKKNKFSALSVAITTFFEQEPHAIVVASFALECRDKKTAQLQRTLKNFFQLWYESFCACFIPESSEEEAALLAREQFTHYFGVFIYDRFFGSHPANDPVR